MATTCRRTPGEDARLQRNAWMLSLGVAVAQCGLAWRLGLPEYALTATIGWTAALIIAHDRGHDWSPTAGPISRWIGATIVVAALLPLWAPAYRTVDRAVPVVAGVGLALAARGPRRMALHWRELVCLLLPFSDPIPSHLGPLIGPTRLVAWCASGIDRLLGAPVSLDGTALVGAAGELDVEPGCSGLYAIVRLSVLAVLFVASFPTSAKQKVWVFAAPIVVGFATNALRVAVLGLEVGRGDAVGFHYWHEGPGATIFTLGATAVCTCAWWVLVRRGAGGPPASQRIVTALS